MIFDRVTLRASSWTQSMSFYKIALGALEFTPIFTVGEFTEWNDLSIFPATAEEPPTRNLHIAFSAPSRAHVDRFWELGTRAGYVSDGDPGERRQYKPDYYGAFLLDPDGNSVEAVHHGSVSADAAGIDHIWLRVNDLTAADAFFGTISAHAGLSQGDRWEGGLALRGDAGALALVADGKPPTEHLEIAFPAIDRETVDDFYAVAAGAGYHAQDLPGTRRDSRDGHYSASVLAHPGIAVGSVFHPSAATGG